MYQIRREENIFLLVEDQTEHGITLHHFEIPHLPRIKHGNNGGIFINDGRCGRIRGRHSSEVSGGRRPEMTIIIIMMGGGE